VDSFLFFRFNRNKAVRGAGEGLEQGFVLFAFTGEEHSTDFRASEEVLEEKKLTRRRNESISGKRTRSLIPLFRAHCSSSYVIGIPEYRTSSRFFSIERSFGSSRAFLNCFIRYAPNWLRRLRPQRTIMSMSSSDEKAITVGWTTQEPCCRVPMNTEG